MHRKSICLAALAGFALLAVVASPVPSPAADLGATRKTVIVAPPVVRTVPVVVVPVLPHIWLGHFTGGRNLAPGLQPLALDWRDEYERFPTRRSCQYWLRALKAVYHRYEGYKTCLPIR
ncbi:MAG: hypothetical protein NVS2B5_18520 [Beijerinckiaceae bacterium]